LADFLDDRDQRGDAAREPAQEQAVHRRPKLAGQPGLALAP
jgi:hypothetical protein